MDNLNLIQQKLQDKNTIFTKEILDLLYEYFILKSHSEINEFIIQLKSDKSFQDTIRNMTLGVTK